MYRYRLSIILKNFVHAGNLANDLALAEQEKGNYREVRKIFLELKQDFEKHDVAIPLEIEKLFILVHSYIRSHVTTKHFFVFFFFFTFFTFIKVVYNASGYA